MSNNEPTLAALMAQLVGIALLGAAIAFVVAMSKGDF